MILAPQKIKMLKIEDIKPNPYQIRRNFNAKKLRNLACSIKEVGILSPIVVRSTMQGYEIVFGERRVRAAQIAGLKQIPSIVIHAGDRECALLSMAENIHRENLGFFEEGEGFFNMLSYHKLKKEAFSQKIAIKNNKIHEKIRLLSLSTSVRYKIEEERIDENIAEELLKLHSEEKQLEIIERIVQEGLNRKQTVEIIRAELREMALCGDGAKRRKGKMPKTPLYINTVKETVEILKRNGAKAELIQTETENTIEFAIKIPK